MLNEKQKELILEMLNREEEFLSKEYDGNNKQKHLELVNSTIEAIERM